MRRSLFAVMLLPLLLAACGGSSRPTYFGHQGSTEGMPGYVNGEKTNPNIKLGKPYRVSGRTYVPKYDPHYVEEGMASWYGPGFHGGKTANGEQFDKYDFTAAHTTLPLPSVVKVTNLKNNRYVYVRVNDRGPFAEERIIDLSKAAAEQIDLVRQGVGMVRVEYMKEASERVVSLMNQGRDPATINLASEIIGRGNMQVASNEPSRQSWWEYVNPIRSARAEEPPPAAAAVVETVQSDDVAPPQEKLSYQPPPQATAPSSFDALTENNHAPAVTVTDSSEIVVSPPIAEGEEVPLSVQAMKIKGPVQDLLLSPTYPAYYVQLGSFSVQENAENMRARFEGPTVIEEAIRSDGGPLYRVRLGPFASAEEAQAAIANAHNSGVGDARVIKP